MFMIMQTSDYKDEVLKHVLSRDTSKRVMCELRMSLFVAAANCTTNAQCLMPFPATFFDREKKSKNFDDLKTHIKDIPRLLSITEDMEFKPKTWELLYWIFTNPLTITPLLTENVDEKIELWKKITELDFPRPNNKTSFMFEVKTPYPKPEFLEGKNKYGTVYAFHGSKIENFHSIIHRGLKSALNVSSSYGHGTYLSSSFQYSNGYSRPGRGWEHSIFGPNIRCEAICEVVAHPDIAGKRFRIGAKGDNSTKIYVVENDDYIQMSHLMVFKAV